MNKSSAITAIKICQLIVITRFYFLCQKDGLVTVSTIGGGNNIKGGYVAIASNRKIVAFSIYKNLKTGNYSFAEINVADPSN